MDKNDMPQSEAEWAKKLTPEQYNILRERGTEAPFSGALLHEKRDGMYRCAACGNALFSSETKFDSGSGWPSFDQAIPGSVVLHEDYSNGMHRTEAVCAQCGSHLGHVFDDGPAETTGKRYCINSVCLELEPKAGGQATDSQPS
jgi:peptide-methionine (R)-S-oxide reductase